MTTYMFYKVGFMNNRSILPVGVSTPTLNRMRFHEPSIIIEALS